MRNLITNIMDNRQKIPTLVFDKIANKWLPKTFESEHCKVKDLEKLTFLTYNVWFDRHNFVERGIELRKILETSNADFICLQEVIQAFYNDLMGCSWVQNYYVSGNPIPGYTNLILSKYPCSFFGKQFPTNMGRSLIYADLEINGIKAAIGTVHLESLGNPNFRKDQLNISYEALRSYKMAFLMGDFNFDSPAENKNITADYVDIWKSLHPDDPGYTMPETPEFKAWRPDRVIMKAGPECKEAMIERVGMEHIEKYKGVKQSSKVIEVMTPSDHYGLRCVVELLQGKQENTKDKLKNKQGNENEKQEFPKDTKNGSKCSLF